MKSRIKCKIHDHAMATVVNKADQRQLEPQRGSSPLPPHSSGAWLFQIPPQRGNLIPELLGAMGISAGQGNGQGKFQLFQLMVTFSLGTALEMAAITGLGKSRGA